MALIVGGLAVGLLYGIFGVGSAFATPMLAVIGIPVASVPGDARRRPARHPPRRTARLRHAFGFLLLGFAIWFLVRQVPPLIA